MSEWPTAKLGLVAEFINGFAFKPHHLTGSGLPVVRIRQLLDPEAEIDYSPIEVSREKHIESGDLIFAWSGSLAVRFWNRGHALLNQHLFKVVPRREVIADRYLAYALTEAIPRLNTHGSTMQHITRPELLSTAIPVPPTELQYAIADYLDRETAEIDAMEADLERLIATLAERRRHSLRELGARLTEPSGESTSLKFLLSKVARPVLDSDGVITAFRDGQVTLRSNRREDGFTVSFTESGYQGVEPGDFVFHGLDGFAGAVGVSDSRGKVSPVYHVCTATSATSEKFMAWALRALAEVGYLEAHAWSVRQRSVDYRNWATFSAMPITYVPLDEQRQIVEQLESTTARIEAMIADARKLKGLLAERRSTLITDVITGRKEVS